MSSPRFDVLLLDLGGVLVQVNGMPAMRAWTGLADAEIWRRWLASPAVRRFETGRCESDEFASSVVAELEIDATPGEFLEQFASWCLEPHPGATELLVELSARYRLACLSNTNALHWDCIQRVSDVLEPFHHLLPSHETQRIKPDREAFEHAIAELDCAPERVVFFDDSPINVEGARAAGLEAHMVADTEALSRALGDLGLR